MDAEARLQNDQRLISALLAKLLDLYWLNWDHHNAFREPLGSATWGNFVGWLKLIREVAHLARSRETQEQLYALAKQTHHNPKAKPLSCFAAFATDGPHIPLRRDLVQKKEGCKTLKLQDIQKFGSCPVCQSPDSVHLYTRTFPT